MQNEELEPMPDQTAPPLSYLPAAPVPLFWNVPMAFFNWAGSMAFSLLVPFLLMLAYVGLFAPHILQELLNKQLTLTRPLVLVNLVGLFLAQLLSLLLCWIIVTRRGQDSFVEALGLQWGTTFQLPQSLLLGVGMFLVSLGIGQLLPQHETDMDMLLKFGLPVRICLVLVATIGAPIQEEIVYRGVLYTALEKQLGKNSGIAIVTLLFWLVHVPQYWKSPATLVAVLLLSLVLTVLRSWTGKLLPCVATHLFFNGIQGLMILLAPSAASSVEPATQPALVFFQ
jgi:membrane protease YdiL (CAAX protease family)